MLPFLEIISDVDVRNRVEELYYRHRDLLFKIAKSHLHNDDLAEEAIQETFVVVAEKCETLDLSNDEEARNLLTVTTKFRALGIYNKNKRNEKLITKITLRETFEESSPEDDYLEQLTIETLVKALHSIDEKYSSVLSLQVINGLKSKDIAELIGKSDGAVRQMLHTARIKIKEIAEKEERIDE